MPYSAQHKQQTRKRITEAARVLFNRHGFEAVSIDMVMKEVGLTRGGFYNHFQNKESLYQAAVRSFLGGRGAQWREAAGINSQSPDSGSDTQASSRMVDSYLSREHLDDLDGQCPMIALPSDTARASLEMQGAYQELLEAMVGLFEADLATSATPANTRSRALAMASLCIGGMVVARTLPESALAEEVREAALAQVHLLIEA